MASAISNAGRIRTNTPAESAYNALSSSSQSIALRQLRLSTGKRINSASDDVSGFITSRSMNARVGSLRSALNAVGDASNVVAIAQDGLDNISSLVRQIQTATASAASGALGTDERVALGQSAFRLVEQIQTVVDSTVFGGQQLLGGTFSGDFVIGFSQNQTAASTSSTGLNIVLQTLSVDLTTTNSSSISGVSNFQINTGILVGSGSTTGRANQNNVSNFAGVAGLNLQSFNSSSISTNDLGLFSRDNISTTLSSLTQALTNISRVGGYLGGVQNRLDSQRDALQSQITNFNAAISRIEDADVAEEQLQLIRSQFLLQTSITSLAQANQNPQNFLQLLR